jgi:DNA-binding transcriptional ArsR family regulator
MDDDEVFKALANPTRRALLDRLRDHPQPVKALAAHFDLGRPAISEHLAVLRNAGLVVEERRGRERHYHLDARPLGDVEDWLRPYEKFWRQRLGDLADLLDDEEE